MFWIEHSGKYLKLWFCLKISVAFPHVVSLQCTYWNSTLFPIHINKYKLSIKNFKSTIVFWLLERLFKKSCYFFLLYFKAIQFIYYLAKWFLYENNYLIPYQFEEVNRLFVPVLYIYQTLNSHNDISTGWLLTI